jgi:putative ABC transport system permease protein
MELKDQPVAEKEQRPTGSCIVASPGYFQLLGLSLLQGRDFNDNDGLPGKEGAIVGRRFIEKFYPRESPIGKQFRLFDGQGKPKEWMTIIGIAPDLRQDDASRPTQNPLVVLPYRSDPHGNMAVLLRARSGPTALTSVLRREVNQLDEELPLFNVQSLEESFQRGRWYLRVFSTLFSTFALIALGMAAVGIYAVMAHSTGQRRREIGVRMALGATVSDIERLVLNRGVKQLLIGTVLGISAAVAVCRLMARLLFQVSPNDPVTLSIVTALLLTTGLTACWVPARRATKLNPVDVLRNE